MVTTPETSLAIIPETLRVTTRVTTPETSQEIMLVLLLGLGLLYTLELQLERQPVQGLRIMPVTF